MDRAAVTPSLYVPDVTAAVRFYADHFGCEQTGGWEEAGALVWAEISRGDARLWFFSGTLPDEPLPRFSGLIYLFTDNVTALADTLRDRLPFEWGPEDQAYGLRELCIRDLNGYRLVFAEDL